MDLPAQEGVQDTVAEAAAISISLPDPILPSPAQFHLLPASPLPLLERQLSPSLVLRPSAGTAHLYGVTNRFYHVHHMLISWWYVCYGLQVWAFSRYIYTQLVRILISCTSLNLRSSQQWFSPNHFTSTKEKIQEISKF